MKKLLLLVVMLSSMFVFMGCSSSDDTVADESVVETAQYVMYSSDNVDQALANNLKVILNFSATRCPVCQELKKEIQANLDKFPKDTAIFEVDFDTYTELKTQYGITQQTTLVYIDTDKSEISRVFRPTLQDVIDMVQ